MIKWIYKPSGNCPVQAEGQFMSHYFYFRARGETASIEFSKSFIDWENNDLVRRYVLHKTEMFKAGWLSKSFCTFLVWKGCFLFAIDKLLRRI
jgi:hypothetical protein